MVEFLEEFRDLLLKYDAEILYKNDAIIVSINEPTHNSIAFGVFITEKTIKRALDRLNISEF